MARSFRLRTKHRNSRAGLRLKAFRRMRWYGIGTASPEVPSNGCSRSCVMKSLDLRRRYISLGDMQNMSFVADMKVASFGALQLSFGITFPPSSAIVSRMRMCMSCH